MSRSIEIEWPSLNARITATLLDNKNPELCDDLWNNLPFKTLQEHGVITGQIIYCWTPIISVCPYHYAEKYTEAPEGRVFYSQQTGNKIVIKYGDCSEDLSQSVIAQINPEDMEILKRVGHQIWDSLFYTKKKIIVEYKKQSK